VTDPEPVPLDLTDVPEWDDDEEADDTPDYWFTNLTPAERTTRIDAADRVPTRIPNGVPNRIPDRAALGFWRSFVTTPLA